MAGKYAKQNKSISNNNKEDEDCTKSLKTVANTMLCVSTAMMKGLFSLKIARNNVHIYYFLQDKLPTTRTQTCSLCR